MENEKKSTNNKENRWFKNIGLLIGYWLVFIIIPFLISNNRNYHLVNSDTAVYIWIYIAFVSPFLVFIPYNKATFDNKIEKIIFVSVGVLVPLVLAYIIITGIGNSFKGI